jgi:lipopolysaccharide/colanic/teichoic acid biosynthesis glycosyltransferase
MTARAAHSIVKSAFDRTAALVGLVACSPVIAGIAVGVRVTMGSPVFFRQQRPGLDAKPFHLVKFRTMSDLRDAQGRPLPDGQRLTPLGRVLRSWSLDELPQLWNVVTGEMSLVGPRPLLMKYVRLYSPEQARRLHVRPGITGWAQVKGRNALGWHERFRLDVWYVDNWSLWLDAKILVLTLVSVLRREGISARGEETMHEFRGNDSTVAS